MGSGASGRTYGSVAPMQQPYGGNSKGGGIAPAVAPPPVRPMPLARPAPTQSATPSPATGGKGGPSPSYFGGPLPSAPSYEQRVLEDRRDMDRAFATSGNLTRADIDARRDMEQARLLQEEASRQRYADMGGGKGGPRSGVAIEPSLESRFGIEPSPLRDRSTQSAMRDAADAALARFDADAIAERVQPIRPPRDPRSSLDDRLNERIGRTQEMIGNYAQNNRRVPRRLLRRMQQLQRRKMLSSRRPRFRGRRPLYSRRPQMMGGLGSLRPMI